MGGGVVELGRLYTQEDSFRRCLFYFATASADVSDLPFEQDRLRS